MVKKYKYIFLTIEGEIIKTNNIKKFGESRGFKNLDWYYLNNLRTDNILKSEYEFLNKWGLNPSVFNVGCLRYLKAVYLPEYFYNKLKGGLN